MLTCEGRNKLLVVRWLEPRNVAKPKWFGPQPNDSSDAPANQRNAGNFNINRT